MAVQQRSFSLVPSGTGAQRLKPNVDSALFSPEQLRSLRLDRLRMPNRRPPPPRSEEHTSELQSRSDIVCRLLREKKKKKGKESKKKRRKEGKEKTKGTKNKR